MIRNIPGLKNFRNLMCRVLVRESFVSYKRQFLEARGSAFLDKYIQNKRHVQLFCYVAYLLLIGCSGGQQSVPIVNEDLVIGKWESKYDGCINALPMPLTEDALWWTVHIKGIEAIEFFADGTYRQDLDLVQDNVIRLNSSISGQWYLDKEQRVHLGNAAWPGAGLEHAQDFDLDVMLLTPNMESYTDSVRMHDEDIMLTIHPRKFTSYLYHAVSLAHDRDNQACGLFQPAE